LRRAHAKVKAVARRVGFSSAEAFSRAYHREFGRWPVDDLRM
jgi:transcriptional regulator GlxA family with amidase domain